MRAVFLAGWPCPLLDMAGLTGCVSDLQEHADMRYQSYFTGIGGMDLGLDRAGMTCVSQCEIDEYRREVLGKAV